MVICDILEHSVDISGDRINLGNGILYGLAHFFQFGSPDYMGGLHNAGWHFHYISGDLTRGGHVLKVSVDKATALIDATDGFEMVLAEAEDFQEMDLAKNVDEALHKAETAETSES